MQFNQVLFKNIFIFETFAMTKLEKTFSMLHIIHVKCLGPEVFWISDFENLCIQNEISWVSDPSQNIKIMHVLYMPSI